MPMTLRAPWSIREVKNLVLRQQNGRLSPYTCHVHLTVLSPTKGGWYCPTHGSIVQHWAYKADCLGANNK